MCFTSAKRIDESGAVIHSNMVPEQYRKNLSQRELINSEFFKLQSFVRKSSQQLMLFDHIFFSVDSFTYGICKNVFVNIIILLKN